MMGDLEQVDPGQAVGEQARIDVLLDIARQQEPAIGDRAQQDYRDVVDRGAGVGRIKRYLPPLRP